MSKRVPEGPPPPPTVQRVRVRYAKRGRLRFSSHRDLARALERAIRRARVPMAYSAGFNPHPKISYVGAAPTGVASESEFFELALAEVVDPAWLRQALDESLPPEIVVLEAVVSAGGSFHEQMEASEWSLQLPPGPSAAPALAALLAAETAIIERTTKSGKKESDVRAALVSASISEIEGPYGRCEILSAVVRTATPTVRPDDLLVALALVGSYAASGEVPMVATRIAQGPLLESGEVGDPLAADRAAASFAAGATQ